MPSRRAFHVLNRLNMKCLSSDRFSLNQFSEIFIGLNN